MIALILTAIAFMAPVGLIAYLALRDENKISEEAELLREWEADSIVRRLKGLSPSVRPGFTNSPGPW